MSRSARDISHHRRGHSEGSMVKEPDEDLALFNEMRTRERNNFLHPSTDDIEATLTTKFGGISGYRSAAATPCKGTRDLLAEPEKNDYDWLLTPPGTPLFPSLDQEAPTCSLANQDVSIRYRSSTKKTKLTHTPTQTQAQVTSRTSRGSSSPSRTSRGSSSPRRSNTPPRTTSAANVSRTRASSAPPVGTGSSRPSTPSGRPMASLSSVRPSTPRSSTPTPTTRRVLAASTTSNGKTAPVVTSRGNSPSRKSKVHPPAMPGFSTEPPPNLRTTLPDRATSNSRGASVSPRLGRHVSAAASDNGWPRRTISPNLSRSCSTASQCYDYASSHSSKGSVTSPRNTGPEVSQAISLSSKITADSVTYARRKMEELSYSSTNHIRKPARTSPSRDPFALAGTASRKATSDATARQMDFKRTNSTSGGFRPLMTNSHISSFYTRASSSLLNRPASSVTDSSINSSSVASSEHGMNIVEGSDQEEAEVSTKWEIRPSSGHELSELDLDEPNINTVSLNKVPGKIFIRYAPEDPDDSISMISNGDDRVDESSNSLLEVVTVDNPVSGKLKHVELGSSYSKGSVQHIPMEICSLLIEPPGVSDTNKEAAATVLEKASGACSFHMKDVSIKTTSYIGKQATESLHVENDLVSPSMMESSYRHSETAGRPESFEACSPAHSDTAACDLNCFSQLLDSKYSLSSMEVYQFNQELDLAGVATEVPIVFDPADGKFSQDFTTNKQVDKSLVSMKVSEAFTSHVAPSLESPPIFHKIEVTSRKFSVDESDVLRQNHTGKIKQMEATHPEVMKPYDGKMLTKVESLTWKSHDEDETISESSCVDYYIDSIESQRSMNARSESNRVFTKISHLTEEIEITQIHEPYVSSPARESIAIGKGVGDVELATKDPAANWPKDSEDRFVDYYIDSVHSDEIKRTNQDILTAPEVLPINVLEKEDTVQQDHGKIPIPVVVSSDQVCYTLEEYNKKMMEDGKKWMALQKGSFSNAEIAGLEIELSMDTTQTQSDRESSVACKDDPLETLQENQIKSNKKPSCGRIICQPEYLEDSTCNVSVDGASVPGKACSNNSRVMSPSQQPLDNEDEQTCKLQQLEDQNNLGGAAPQGTSAAAEHANKPLSKSAALSRNTTLKEAADTILFCSSIVHDLVYRAATMSMETQLSFPATPASAEEFVTLLGISKTRNNSFRELDSWKKGQKEVESTVRRTLTYMQNQKSMRSPTVAYLPSPIPIVRVEEDVKDPEVSIQEKAREELKVKSKCRCTIM